MSTTTRGTCPDPELFTALVDGEVDGVTRAQITLHAGTCAECTAAIAAERRAKAAVAELGEPALSADLTARLLAVAASEGQSAAPIRSTSRRRRLPSYFAAAASVAVLMVGAFTFLGATDDTSPSSPSRTTAIVPAADRLAQEHALTAVQAGFGGPGAAAVPVSVPVASSSAVAR